MKQYSLIDAVLEVDRELDYTCGKHEHLFGIGEFLSGKHEKRVRIDRQWQRIGQVHVLQPIVGGLGVSSFVDHSDKFVVGCAR